MSKFLFGTHKICKALNNFYFIKNSILFLSLITIVLFGSQNLTHAETVKKPIGTGYIGRISPTAQIALTTIDDKISVEAKASLINELIQRAPKNKVIYIVIEPSTENKAYYNELLSLIDVAAENARKTNGVRVRVKMVNHKLTAEIKDYLHSKNGLTDTTMAVTDNFVLKLKDNDIIFSEEDAPKDLVSAINRETSLLRLFFGAPLRAITAPITSLKSVSVSGLAISTVLTHQGLSTIGPSWVYVNDGVMSKEMIMSYALSLGLLYYIPRQEHISKEYYELTYDFLRSPWQAFRAVWHKLTGRNVYLNQANPNVHKGFNAFAGAVGFSIPLQAAFYYLQDGNAVENMEMILKNGFLIGAASAPYSFLTDKLKKETNLSTNLITHLRTGQLALIGFLVAGMPAYNGLDAKLFNINTIEEAMLLAMGAVGVFANYTAVDLVNKLDKNRFYRFINANFQALTDATGNFFRKLVGLKPTESEFLSWTDVTNLIADEIAGITRNTVEDDEVVTEESSAPIFRRSTSNTCEAYLR